MKRILIEIEDEKCYGNFLTITVVDGVGTDKMFATTDAIDLSKYNKITFGKDGKPIESNFDFPKEEGDPEPPFDDDEYAVGYTAGWNSCVKAITGGW